jgi:hypothetical protein
MFEIKDFDMGPLNQIKPLNVFNDTEVCVIDSPITRPVSIIQTVINVVRNIFNFLFGWFSRA